MTIKLFRRRRRPSSTFYLKGWFLKNDLYDNFFPFWCTAALGRFQCTVHIWIWLNRHKGRKGQIWLISLGGNCRKNCLIFYLGMKFFKEGIYELSKDGFDWIALKVIFQGPNCQKKVIFDCFATFYQFDQKRLHFFIQLLGDDIINCQEPDVIELFERSFSRSERSDLAHCAAHHIYSLEWTLWSIGANISETVFIWNTYTKSYKIVHFTFKPLTLDDF